MSNPNVLSLKLLLLVEGMDVGRRGGVRIYIFDVCKIDIWSIVYSCIRRNFLSGQCYEDNVQYVRVFDVIFLISYGYY